MFKLEIGTPSLERASDAAILEYLKLATEFLGTIAWPIAAVTIVLIFREQLVSLTQRVKQFSAPGGINATFENELEKTRELAGSSPDLAAEADASPQAEISSPDLAQIYPEAAILQSYHEIEKLLRRVSPEKGVTASGLLNALNRLQIIGADVRDLFDQIRRTRNAAVHSERPITTGEALEFQALAQLFIHAINKAVPAINSNREQLQEMLVNPKSMRF
ncbi:hypothetical protein GGQ64_003375 [Rhizobium azooxidifex]|uniref:DUF4145 domain-containing protein n=1 Tax=Mycoplana azooxidifex TaxID=1636188 RepID=A0A7W6DBH6_9HYPH|nr:DUF4145 domain-containing protein [Mycoplana azooxidifex]MBB3978161.1 hypothetical protein [Mycoplana azooxidifex]